MTSAARNIQEQTSQHSHGQRVCERHGKYEAKIITVNPITKNPIMESCPKCTLENEIQEKKDEEMLRKQQIRENFHKAMIPRRFMKSTLSGYRGECDGSKRALAISCKYVEEFRRFRKNGTSLVFCGHPGTGKTHLACAVVNNIIKAGYTARYMTVYKAVSSVKETYNGNGKSESQVIREFQKTDLLILDEVGVQFGTDAEKVILYQIINGRYENMLPIIMISNLNEQNLTDYIGERCMDRMRESEGAVIPFTWKSFRANKKIEDS